MALGSNAPAAHDPQQTLDSLATSAQTTPRLLPAVCRVMGRSAARAAYCASSDLRQVNSFGPLMSKAMCFDDRPVQS